MQPEKTKDEQARERKEATRELAQKLWQPTKARPQEQPDAANTWTLTALERLEAENTRLQMRVERLEQHQLAESARPRFPHQGPPLSREEWRVIAHRIGWHKTADLF
jgi:hypothetical protein